MYRPDPKFKIYDPTISTEYDLANSFSAEAMKFVSPKIIYWRLDKDATDADQSDDEDIYNEKIGETIFKDPLEIFGYIEVNPIIQEITRLGIEQLEELNIFVNLQEVVKILGEKPKGGDIMRISYFREQTQDKNTFYKVGTSFEADLYNFQYMHYVINAEQTNMSDVPKHICEYEKFV